MAVVLTIVGIAIILQAAFTTYSNLFMSWVKDFSRPTAAP
jgi:hypothetical protein